VLDEFTKRLRDEPFIVGQTRFAVFYELPRQVGRQNTATRHRADGIDLGQ
jgi:hypothetical protein